MKKIAALLFSVSLLVLFTSNTVVSQKVSNDVAYSGSINDHPIHPPVG